MAGIVTTSSNGGNSRLYKMVFTSTSTSLAINWISGTTSGGTTLDPLDKGSAVTFQNISTGGVSVWVGGAEVAIQSGILLTQNASYTVAPRPGGAGSIQMREWYIATTSSMAQVIAHLIHYV